MKVKEITPKAFACACGACPAVFETDRGTYLIIVTGVNSAKNLLTSKIGRDETAVDVPASLIQEIATK